MQPIFCSITNSFVIKSITEFAQGGCYEKIGLCFDFCFVAPGRVSLGRRKAVFHQLYHMYNEIYLDGNGSITSQTGPMSLGILLHYNDIVATVNALPDNFEIFWLDGADSWPYPDIVEFYPGDGTYVLFIIYYDLSGYVTSIYGIVENMILF